MSERTEISLVLETMRIWCLEIFGSPVRYDRALEYFEKHRGSDGNALRHLIASGEIVYQDGGIIVSEYARLPWFERGNSTVWVQTVNTFMEFIANFPGSLLQPEIALQAYLRGGTKTADDVVIELWGEHPFPFVEDPTVLTSVALASLHSYFEYPVVSQPGGAVERLLAALRLRWVSNALDRVTEQLQTNAAELVDLQLRESELRGFLSVEQGGEEL